MHRLVRWDVDLCLWASRAKNRRLLGFFSWISRLGDGVFWYATLALILILDGWQGSYAVLHMAVVGIASLLIYSVLKKGLARPRPFVAVAGIKPFISPLDQYSFPSGHTLHAASFTVVGVHYYPGLAIVAVPFLILVSVSRVLLGLHYPTDVVAGGLLGSAVAGFSLFLV